MRDRFENHLVLGNYFGVTMSVKKVRAHTGKRQKQAQKEHADSDGGRRGYADSRACAQRRTGHCVDRAWWPRRPAVLKQLRFVERTLQPWRGARRCFSACSAGNSRSLS